MTKPLNDEALDMLQARAITAQQTAYTMLMVYPDEMLAMVAEVRGLRDLVARLMEALRRPVGWPTTEAAMLEHARRAGAVLDALTTLEERGDGDVVLVLARVNGVLCRAALADTPGFVDADNWPDALIALAREVQQ